MENLVLKKLLPKTKLLQASLGCFTISYKLYINYHTHIQSTNSASWSTFNLSECAVFCATFPFFARFISLHCTLCCLIFYFIISHAKPHSSLFKVLYLQVFQIYRREKYRQGLQFPIHHLRDGTQTEPAVFTFQDFAWCNFYLLRLYSVLSSLSKKILKHSVKYFR